MEPVYLYWLWGKLQEPCNSSRAAETERTERHFLQGNPSSDEGETHARPRKGGDYPFDAKEIKVQGGSGGGIGCVWGGQGVWGSGPRKGGNGKSGPSQTERGPEGQAKGNPSGWQWTYL